MVVHETPWNLEYYGDSSEPMLTEYVKMIGEILPMPEASTLYFFR